MLGKLIKYEMKALGRSLLPFYGALIAISVINRILDALNLTIPLSIGAAVYSFMIGFVCVITIVLVLQRFRRNLLGSEGYLMFTLPVSTDMLIISKIVTVFIWTFLSLISISLSVLIMCAGKVSISDITRLIDMLILRLHISGADFQLVIIESFVCAKLALLGSIMLLYACMSLSLLVNKHRGLFTFGAFAVVSIVWQIITSLVFKIFFQFQRDQFSIEAVHKMMAIGIFGAVATAVVFYFVTRFMLSRKLNIE